MPDASRTAPPALPSTDPNTTPHAMTSRCSTLRPRPVLSRPVRSRHSLRHALRLVCAAALFFAWCIPAHAQEMPAWAAPSEGPAASTEASGDAERPPDFPPAPLDPLGLGVLAAAGAALAVRRLRNTPGREDRPRR